MQKYLLFYDECEKHIQLSAVQDLDALLESKFNDSIEFVAHNYKNEISQNQKKYISSETLKIPMKYSDSLEFSYFISTVKAFVYYRLFYYLQNFSQRTLDGAFVLYKYLLAIEIGNKNELFFPLVLHESRGLIDDELAGKRSAQYIELSTNMLLVDPDPNDELQKNYQEGVSFFRKTLDTPLGYKAIQQFLISIFADPSEENVKKTMNGVNGKVYFNIDMLKPKQSQRNKSRTLGNCYHEGAHYLFRKLKEDFGVITPRSHDKESLEAGFRMEEILFGNYQKTYWILFEDILNEKYWSGEKELPLLEQEKLIDLEDRNFSNPYRSGCEGFIYVGYE